MRFRVRFQDPNRDTENLMECDTLEEAEAGMVAIRRYAIYLGDVNLPICTVEYRPSDEYAESAWQPVPRSRGLVSAQEAAQELMRDLMARFN